MNTSTSPPSSSAAHCPWEADLLAARDLSRHEKHGFQIVLGWFETWRVRRDLPPGRDAAAQFWRSQVKSKNREEWQLIQWQQAFRWYLRWLQFSQEHGESGRSIAERVKQAVHRVGGRRGLALETRRSYAGWAVRYAIWVVEQKGSAFQTSDLLDETHARDYLSVQVVQENKAFSTQKQGLSALAFFFRDVCGREEVDLEVTLRRTPKRIPVVLTSSETRSILDHLPPRYQLAAELQYGSGLRIKELVNLRVKDIDPERGQLTVRGGKGDKDRITVLPQTVGEKLKARKKELRELHEADRQAGYPGVALPHALERKMPKAGETWSWFWLFPAAKLSRDPDTGMVRRHHLLGEVYAEALKRAAELAHIEKRFTSHVLRHSFDSLAAPGSVTLRAA